MLEYEIREEEYEEEDHGECYLCGAELTRHDDSARCETCLDELSESGEGWDN